MGVVGGVPEHISVGAQTLSSVAKAVDTMPGEVNAGAADAAGACGHPVLAGAADRFGACWSHRLGALATEVYAAGELAANAAADLATAGGQGPR